MIQQQSNALTFYAHYIAAKVSKTGLTVTVDVYEVTTGTPIISGASATELGGGLYYYTLASGSVDANGAYIAIFKTSDSSVDQQHLPAIWQVGTTWVANLDAAISSRSAPGDAMDLVAGAIDAAAIATDAIDADAIAADAVAEIAAAIPGTVFPAGAIDFTYTVTDSVSGLPLPGVDVFITTDLAGVNGVWRGLTDTFGVARDVNNNLPSLDAGVYFFWRDLSGYIFQDPDQETVS